ncbi:NAD(P)H:quinone oxidoreductase, type IV [Neoconidiobolus thromboides FSU 785]|nr:NAD(P)H:quinone oxidoreductase, type IV [Neoconidiobolus thromboides FSU 785]
MTRTTKIYIPYYSTYQHIYTLAKAIKEGAERVPNVEVKLFQVPETLPEEVLAKMHAPAKPEDVEIITPELLKEADGFLFGIPTRFGMMPAQWKHFWDGCGGLWATGALNGKFAGTFVSSNTQHGGQETTHLTFLTTVAHFGMVYVPLGYASSHLQEANEVIGGSPYGASVVAGENGSKQASEKELEIGRAQGENFAKLVSTYVKGSESA